MLKKHAYLRVTAKHFDDTSAYSNLSTEYSTGEDGWHTPREHYNSRFCGHFLFTICVSRPTEFSGEGEIWRCGALADEIHVEIVNTIRIQIYFNTEKTVWWD